MMKNILLTGLGNGLCRKTHCGSAAFPKTLVSSNAKGSGSKAPADFGFGIVLECTWIGWGFCGFFKEDVYVKSNLPGIENAASSR